jgi:hypothetical protein
LLLPLDLVSFKNQPVRVRLFVVPVLARVLKSWVYALPRVVRLTEPDPPPSACALCIGTAINIKARMVITEITFEKDLVMVVLLKQSTI